MYRNVLKKITAVILIFALVVPLLATDMQEASAASKSPVYWIKVNKQANVATAYKKIAGKYKPVRAMLISCGGSQTPSGTFYTKGKYRWRELMDEVYGQYCTRITGSILFHSVWYHRAYDKSSQSAIEFNKLGKTASHGCVRLSVIDAKWIYDNCRKKTKVTIYSRKKSGPLGKPKPLKIGGYMSWDPTDPDNNNPIFLLRKPKITISAKKPKKVEYGRKYTLKLWVRAKNPNANENITRLLKVVSVKKKSSGKYRKAKFSTKKLGIYKITYRVSHKYSGKATKSFIVRVVDTIKPTIKAKNRTVRFGAVNAVKGVTAKQKSVGRTKAVKTYIKVPGSSKYKRYSYNSAKKYKFRKEGTYIIKYKVANKYKPYRTAVKAIRVYCYKDAAISVDSSKINIAAGDSISTARTNLRAALTIKDGKIIAGSKATVTFNTKVFIAGETYKATVSYKGRNKFIVRKVIVITIPVPEPVPDPDPEPGTDPDPEPGSEPEQEPGSEPDPDPGSEPESELQPQPELPPGTLPESEISSSIKGCCC